MKVKVCGLRHPDNIGAVASLGIDYAGFIFYRKSPRYAGEVNAEVIAGLQSAGVEPVALFVDENMEEVKGVMMRGGFRTVQLHGSESPDYCDRLRALGYKVLKAISVADRCDLDRCTDYDGHADMLVIDTKCVGKGGSGRKFDWSVLAGAVFATPFLLSGGIGPEDAVAVTALYRKMEGKMAGVDLNSRFESEPGRKEPQLLSYFLNGLPGQ